MAIPDGPSNIRVAAPRPLAPPDLSPSDSYGSFLFIEKQLAQIGVMIDFSPQPVPLPDDWDIRLTCAHYEVDPLLDNNSLGSTNLLSYADPVVSNLLAAADPLIDDASRRHLRKRVLQAEHDDPPLVPLVFQNNLAVVSKRFCGVQLDPFGVPRLDQMRPCTQAF
jgi:ABC-type transport system substrate-binding protein